MNFFLRYAFIEFKSSSSARLAATRADQTYIDDRCVFTEMEIERELPGKAADQNHEKKTHSGENLSSLVSCTSSLLWLDKFFHWL